MVPYYESNSAVAWGLAHSTPYGSQLLAFFWSLLIITTAFVCARFYARRLARKVGWDDWLILGALVLHIACTSLQTKLVETLYLNTSQSVDRRLTLILWYSAQIAQVLAGFLGQASVAAFLRRTFRLTPLQKYLVAFCLVSTLILGLLFVSITTASCDVTRNSGHEQSSQCLDPYGWGIAAIVIFVWSIVIDICLAAIPAMSFSTLHIHKGEKIGLYLLTITGWIVTIAAVVKTWQFTSIALDLGQGSFFTLYILGSIELLLIIVCACIPTLKPIYYRHFGRWSGEPIFLSSRSSIYPLEGSEDKEVMLIEKH